jgi:hypothetical protein
MDEVFDTHTAARSPGRLWRRRSLAIISAEKAI